MTVRCPKCRRLTEFTSQNPFRPFCSERCATLDLGAWADEQYKVPVSPNSEEETDPVNEKSDDECLPSSPSPKKMDLN